MKRKIVAALLVLAVAGTGVIMVTSQQSKHSESAAASQEQEPINDTREQRHKEREQRRAARLAEYERYMDSIVMARNFKFIPSSVQQEPAGSTRLINNPNYELSVWDTEVDVCLPYIKGVTPPYYFVLLNYTLPSVTGYITEQTRDGWNVSFSTSLFSATTYRFSLDIFSSSGSATLTIASTWYPDVQYNGAIVGIN
ncbi:MAG: DUF4251 domain-containing protein [Alistipes sp.]|nr:DUF4251 domain-containing protein [Alistipes sp.]